MQDASRQGGASQPDVEQATLPAGRIDVVSAWTRGDEAFQAGDAEAAQEQFGLVYIADPNFRGGQIRSALFETCRVLGNDCGLVMGRLDLLRLDYADLVGPREQWVTQQETDYQAILTCYDEGLAGNYDTAYYAGHGALTAPLPQFAQLARACVDRVETLRTQAMAQEHLREASRTWDESFPEFASAYADLDAALDADDWDAIVDAYPLYKVAEEPVADIVDEGVLTADPERADDVERAASWLTEVREWEEGHTDDYEQMRDAITRLDEDPDYNQALIEYQEVYNRLQPLQEEVSSLEMARDVTTGEERTSVERRIDAKETEIREVRRELRRIMSTINSMRRDVGLPVREAPYGLEE